MYDSMLMAYNMFFRELPFLYMYRNHVFFFLPVYFYYSDPCTFYNKQVCMIFPSFLYTLRQGYFVDLSFFFLGYLTMDPNVHSYHLYLDLRFFLFSSTSLAVFSQVDCAECNVFTFIILVRSVFVKAV